MTEHPRPRAVNAAQERIAHLQAHLRAHEESKADRLRHIRDGTGDPRACVSGLSSHAQAAAMHAWFAEGDLRALRQWSYLAGRLDQASYQMQGDAVDLFNAGPVFWKLMHPLLSNQRALVDWFAGFDAAHDLSRSEDPGTFDFWNYQAILALRGDWPRLAARCERVLADPPGTLAHQQIDHRFYLALAQRDEEGLNRLLAQMLQPDALRERQREEGGYTAGLVDTRAVVFAKIATWHGHRITVESPFLPREWLADDPLDQYDDDHEFLRQAPAPAGPGLLRTRFAASAWLLIGAVVSVLTVSDLTVLADGLQQRPVQALVALPFIAFCAACFALAHGLFKRRAFARRLGWAVSAVLGAMLVLQLAVNLLLLRRIGFSWAGAWGGLFDVAGLGFCWLTVRVCAGLKPPRTAQDTAGTRRGAGSR